MTSALEPPAASRKFAGSPPACATTSSVLIASPAPLPRIPMSPSSATYCRPSACAFSSIGSIAPSTRQRRVLRVAVERVVVERDLRVERLDLAVGRDDQRVDLGEGRVLLRPDLVEADEDVRDALGEVRVDAAVARRPSAPRPSRARRARRCGGARASRASSRRPPRCRCRPPWRTSAAAPSPSGRAGSRRSTRPRCPRPSRSTARGRCGRGCRARGCSSRAHAPRPRWRPASPRRPSRDRRSAPVPSRRRGIRARSRRRRRPRRS